MVLCESERLVLGVVPETIAAKKAGSRHGMAEGT